MPQPQIRELSPVLGAEVLGVDLSSRLDEKTVEFLRASFDDRGLLLFRDVDIDRTRQYYLSTILRGHEPPSEVDSKSGAERQGNFWISNKEPDAAAPFGRLLFHCDGMWSGEPFEVLSLYAVDVQPPVIPTAFVSSIYAWETLPDVLRRRVEGLHAEHVTGPEYIHERRRLAFGDELSQPVRDTSPSSTLPVVHRHPRTGKTVLYVTQGMTKGIAELSSEESEDLLEELFDHLYRSFAVLRHEWRNGDLILWDNMAVQHARPNVTTSGPTRTLRKIGLPVPTSAEAQQVQVYQRVS
jgi:taurine dioxygenase